MGQAPPATNESRRRSTLGATARLRGRSGPRIGATSPRKTGERVRHPRTAARASLLPEHRAAMLDTVRGGRARLYFQRQSLWELGPAAEAWLTELVHRRPAQWRPDVEDCFTLLQDYGPVPVLRALAWGVDHGAIGAEYVRTQLARSLAA